MFTPWPICAGVLGITRTSAPWSRPWRSVSVVAPAMIEMTSFSGARVPRSSPSTPAITCGLMPRTTTSPTRAATALSAGTWILYFSAGATLPSAPRAQALLFGDAHPGGIRRGRRPTQVRERSQSRHYGADRDLKIAALRLLGGIVSHEPLGGFRPGVSAAEWRPHDRCATAHHDDLTSGA